MINELKILAIFYANLGNSSLKNIFSIIIKSKKNAFQLNGIHIVKAFVIILVGKILVNKYIDNNLYL
jgi:hypothetical protein